MDDADLGSFNEKHLDNIQDISLILLRHTLEHIPNPTLFLTSLFDIIKKGQLKNVPIFIEVPDVEWIFANKAYWDFFYEHVNYFSKNSLYHSVKNANGIVTSIKSAFENQYQWAEAIINSDTNLLEQISEPGVLSFDTNLNLEITIIAEKLKPKIKGRNLVIWGMASKGIIYSLHLINNNIEPDYFIDININKQDKYIPLIGKLINNPNQLPKDKSLLIICMNPNYITEISQQCNSLNLDFELISPSIVNY